MSAEVEPGRVRICVEDNGRGLSREKILAKALKQGIISEYEVNRLYKDQEIYQLITLPGFSTKEEREVARTDFLTGNKQLRGR